MYMYHHSKFHADGATVAEISVSVQKKNLHQTYISVRQSAYYRLTDDDMKLRAVSLRRLSFLYNIVYGRVSERIQYGNTMWRQSRNTPESGACEKVWLLPVNVRTSW